MTQSHNNIGKKWSRRGQVLRAIIHIHTKLFTHHHHHHHHNHHPHHHKVDHNNGDYREDDHDAGKLSSSSFVVGLLPSLGRVPSRGLKGLQKLGRVVSMRKDHQKEDCGRVELCKMRIIMGKKCRPLNASGVLRYDENGVLVPELLDFFSPCRD